MIKRIDKGFQPREEQEINGKTTTRKKKKRECKHEYMVCKFCKEVIEK